MLINSIKKSCRIIFENPSIALFLVLFLILSNFILSALLTSKIKIMAALLVFCVCALSAMFLSGWFEVIRESYDIEKIREKNYYTIFFDGFAKNIVPVSSGIIVYLVCGFIVFFLARETAHHFFGGLDFLFKDIASLSSDNTSIAQYLNNLTIDQKYTIYAWQLCFMGFVSVFNFCFLFYFPSLLKNKKETITDIVLTPFVSILSSLKFVFKNFLSVFALYLFVQVLHFIPALSNALIKQSTFGGFLALFLCIYLAAYVVVLIFNYYDEKNNSSDRRNSIGQNEVGSESGTQA